MCNTAVIRVFLTISLIHQFLPYGESAFLVPDEISNMAQNSINAIESIGSAYQQELVEELNSGYENMVNTAQNIQSEIQSEIAESVSNIEQQLNDLTLQRRTPCSGCGSSCCGCGGGCGSGCGGCCK